MKFPVKTCIGCGLDLTTVEPAEIKNPGEVALVGTCPQCSAPYFMVEDSALLSDEPEVGPVTEPEPLMARGRRRASEPEPEPEPETPPEE